MARPSGIHTKHKLSRKTRKIQGPKEWVSYYERDDGCKEATKFLGGKQSHCLECPFPECFEKMADERISSK